MNILPPALPLARPLLTAARDALTAALDTPSPATLTAAEEAVNAVSPGLDLWATLSEAAPESAHAAQELAQVLDALTPRSAPEREPDAQALTREAARALDAAHAALNFAYAAHIREGNPGAAHTLAQHLAPLDAAAQDTHTLNERGSL